MVPNVSQNHPKTTPKRCESRIKVMPKRSQNDPKCPKVTPKWFPSNPKVPQSVSEVTQSGSQVTQNGSQVSESNPQVPQSGSKVTPSGTQVPQSGSQVSENETQMTPKRLQIGRKLVLVSNICKAESHDASKPRSLEASQPRSASAGIAKRNQLNFTWMLPEFTPKYFQIGSTKHWVIRATIGYQ